MFCKTFFLDDGNLINVKKTFDNIQEDYQIITDEEFLNEFLKKSNKRSSCLSEVFSEISNENRSINDSAFIELEKYRKKLEHIKFREISIFNGIENQLLEDIIFLEKNKRILNKKENIIFLFSKFSSTHFLIQKIAAELGYEIESEFSITGIGKRNNVTLSNSQNISKFENNKKFEIVKNQLGISNTINVAGKLLVKKTIHNRKKELEKILDKISKKTSIDKNETKKNIGFFLTSDRIDFLKPFFLIIKELEKMKIPHVIFTVDFMTKKILKQEKIPFIDLSEISYFVIKELQKNNQVNTILRDFQNTSKLNESSIIYDNQFSENIKNNILKSISIIEIFDQVLEKNQFSSIGIAIDGSMLGNLISQISKKYSVPSFSIESFYVNENLERKNLLKADKICIYGTQGYRALERLGYQKNRLITTGNPIYDYIKKMDKLKARNDLGIGKHKENEKIILISLGRWYENDEIWMSKLIKFCNKQGIVIYLKIHPRYKTWNRKESDQKIKAIKDNCKHLDFTISYDLDISTLVSAADLVITDFSNVGLEASLANKKVITVNFNTSDWSNVPQYHKYSNAINIKKYEDLESSIISLFNKKSNQKNDIDTLISEFNYLNDGNATNRICHLLIEPKIKC